MATSHPDPLSGLPKQRKWPRRLAAIVACFAVGLFFLPALLSISPLKQRLIDWATTDLNGQLTVESVSLGWFSPIELKGVNVQDAQGQTVITVAQVVTSNRLIDFARTANLGRIEITQPSLLVQLTEQGSNLESVFTTYLRPRNLDSTTNPIPRLELVVVNGNLQLTDTEQNPGSQVESIQATLSLGTQDSPLQGLVSFQTPRQSQAAGQLSLDFSVDPGKKELTGSSINAKIKSDQFPLSILDPLMDRLLGPVTIQGQLTGTLTTLFDLHDQQVSLNIKQLHAQDVDVLAANFLGSDRLSLQRVDARGNVCLTSQRITAKQFSAESDIGEVRIDGEFDITQMWEMVAKGQLPSSPFEMDIETDLARVVPMLPKTLGIREDVQITSGTVTVHANTRSQSNVQRIMFNMDVANVQAQQAERQIVWNRPLRVTGTASENNGQVLVENLSVESDFLELVGKASLAKGNFTFQGDLEKLRHQLGDFLDLSQFEIAGQFGGRLAWQAAPLSESGQSVAPIQFESNVVIEKPMVLTPVIKRWADHKVQFDVQGRANFQNNGGLGMEQGQLSLIVGGEVLSLNLLQPISDLKSLDGLEMSCKTSGSISRWLNHIRNVTDMPAFAADGSLTSECVIAYDSPLLKINQLNFTANQFSFAGQGLLVEEPQVIGTGDFEFQLETGELLIQSGSLSSSALAATTNQLWVGFSDQIQLTGPVAYQADLQRTGMWFGCCRPTDQTVWSGIAEGQVDFASKNRAIGGVVSTRIQGLTISQWPSPDATFAGIAAANPITRVSASPSRSILWEEDEVVINATVFVDDQFQGLRFGGLKLDSKLLDLRGNGRIDELGSQMVANISGKWNLDWDSVNQWARAAMGDLGFFQGVGWQDIMIKGPLSPEPNEPQQWVAPNLQAQSGLAWNRADILGVPIAPGQLTISLNDSIFRLESNSPGFAGNLAKLFPALDCRTDNPVLTLQSGQLINDIKLTPEHTRQWLKFATPMLADATSAEGIIGLSTQGVQIPLMQPLKTSARGQLHLKDIAIGPGPMAHQLLPLLDQLLLLIKPKIANQSHKKTWVTVGDQVVTYAVQNERVYHDQLKFDYKGMTIVTSGSVGFDHTLDIVASIKILDHWLQKEPLLAGLRGQSINIPISGTFSHPQLNRQAMAGFSREFLKRTARSAISNVVGEQLEAAGENLGGKVSQEIDKLQGGFNQIMQEEVGDKLEAGWRNGLGRLFNKREQDKAP